MSRSLEVRHELSKKWIDSRKRLNYSESGLSTSACIERKYVDFLRDLGVDLLSAEFKHYLRFIDYKISQGRARDTVLYYKSTIGNIYWFIEAMTEQDAKLTVDLIKEHNLSRYSFDGGFERKALTIDEVEKLQINIQTPRNKLMAFTVFCTGFRNRAVRSLRLDDIDYENLTIKVRNPKGGGPAYSAAMPRVLAIKLKQWKQIGRKSNPWHMDHDFLFPSKRDSGKLTSNEAFIKPIKDAAERAGIQEVLATTTEIRNGSEITKEWKKVTPHTLRHTYITYLKKSGASSDARQQAANHKNMSTTRRYEHTDGEYNNAIRSIFDSTEDISDF
jgi:integrase/recombinase XerD